MTSIQGTGQAASTQYSHEPIQTSQANPFYQPQLERLEESFLERMEDLSQQLAASQDPVEKLQIREEMGSLEAQFNGLRMHPEAGGPPTSALVMDIGELISEMQAALVHSYERFGTAELPAEVFTCGPADHSPLVSSFIDSVVLKGPAVAQMMDGIMDRLGVAELLADRLPSIGLGALKEEGTTAPGQVGPSEVAGQAPADSANLDEVGASDGADAPASVDTAGSSAEVDASDAGSRDGDFLDPAEMMNLFHNDQAAFFEALQDIENPTTRMEMMSMVQNELQKINQLFSMMSQFSQAVHDTHKAVINNLRV